MIWFTSDTHYHHKNIVKGISRWDDRSRCRNFSTADEMDVALVENINRVVSPDDTLFHLGDFSFSGVSRVHEFRGKINCKNIHLILGNHDTELYADPTAHALFSTVSFYREIDINGQKAVLCHFPLRTWHRAHKGSWMLHGHCHGNLEHQIPASLLRDLIDYGKWDVIHKLAEGDDSHGYYPNGKTLDVGVDTHPEFRPYSFTEIAEIMSTRSIHPIDHHE